ncbi:MAG TPA: RNA polymerase sigma factor RpoH [Chromatiales bacterium]|jgi:RNA polymerase sigma-32 factor|nr:RNA polymerase sigma factor RpoH [Chromatiaceae bacterium]HIO55190.1 RNA polymerase sigma factor RpoH [Chromatiales bacterium]
MNNSLALSTNIGGNLDLYYKGIRDIPVLSSEEEHDLAVRLRDHGDLDAAKQLVLSNLRFVAHIARSYSGYGLAMNDLVQEGNIGLMKAVKRFNPEIGVRLVSFAVYWIRAEIHEFVLKNWRIVKVATTKAQRKLFFNLRGSKKHLGWFSHDEVQAVAEDLGVKPETVLEMESRLSGKDIGFDAPAGKSNDNELHVAPAGYLPDQRFDPARQIEAADTDRYEHQQLAAGLATLDDRSRDILQARWMSEDKATLHELAQRYSVSAERIRQIEAQAIKKLRSQLAA